MTSLTEQGLVENVDEIDLLYVNCVKSIRTMSKATLYNITYDESYLKKLKSYPHNQIYNEEMFSNDSPVAQKRTAKLVVETSDKATMRLERSHHYYFNTSEQTYREWGAKAAVGAFWKGLGIKVSGGNTDKKWTSSESVATQSGAMELFRTSTRRALFEYKNDLTVPPFSHMLVSAWGMPLQGEIPFTAVYELSPTGNHSPEVLEKTLKMYGMEEKIEKTNHGTLLVSYDGFMEIDAGHKVNVSLTIIEMKETFVTRYIAHGIIVWESYFAPNILIKYILYLGCILEPIGYQEIFSISNEFSPIINWLIPSMQLDIHISFNGFQV